MSTTFHTTDTEYKDRNGQTVEVLSVITEPDDKHDLEVLPMYIIQFPDGVRTEVWADELKETR